MSPAGEAFATLPPSVPRFWICGLPTAARGLGQDRQPAARRAADRRIARCRWRARRSRACRRGGGCPRSARRRERSRKRAALLGAEVQADVEVGAAGERHERPVVAQSGEGAGERAGLRRARGGRGGGTLPRLRAPAGPAIRFDRADRGRRAASGQRPYDAGVAGASAEVPGQRLAHARGESAAAPSAAAAITTPGRADAALRAALAREGLGRRGREGPRSSSRFRPRTWASGTRHALTGSPSRRTVHAPHSPSPHPSFVPARPQSSRRTSRSRFRGGA